MGESYAGITVPEGDPGAVRSAAAQLHGVAGQLQGACAQLTGLPGSIPAWQGRRA